MAKIVSEVMVVKNLAITTTDCIINHTSDPWIAILLLSSVFKERHV
jgi:hypothetical protein